MSESIIIKKTFSFSKSLGLSVIGIVSLALLLAYLAFVVQDYYSSRRSFVDNTSILAEIAANNSQGALSFMDEEAAAEVLFSLHPNSSIRYTALLNVDGSVFVEEASRWRGKKAPHIIQRRVIFNKGYIEMSRPVIWDDETIGYVYLLADVQTLTHRLWRSIIIGGVIFVLALLFSYFLSLKMVSFFSRPVLQLVKLAKMVVKENDYSLRVESSRVTELNSLVDSVHQMLHEINLRDIDLEKGKERLSLALWGGNEGMWDWDVKSGEILLGDHSRNILGYVEKNKIISVEKFLENVSSDDECLLAYYKQGEIHKGNESYSSEYRFQLESKKLVWIRMAGKVEAWGEDGRPLRLVGTLKDITEQKRTEQDVQLYATVFDSTSNAVAILNPDLLVLAVNVAYTEAMRSTTKDVVNKEADFIQSDVNGNVFSLQMIEQWSQSGFGAVEAVGCHLDGSVFPIEISVNSVMDENSILTHYVVVFTDITERKQSEVELRFMAKNDALTGLPNRASFHEKLEAALNHAKRNNSIVALLFIDLDRFKQVNDVMGHEAGDNLLIKVAEILHESTRNTDIISRLGGDEFTAILTNIKHKDDVRIIVTKIMNEFSKGIILDGESCGVGCSIGIAIYPDDKAEGPSELLSFADAAMYGVKNTGRNNFLFYDKNMYNSSCYTAVIEKELLNALQNNEFSLVYQPKVTVSDLTLTGFEALIRWNHPTLGCVPPDQFISIAESNGTIIDIGRWVLKTTCQKLKQWQLQGYENIPIAINVSPRQLQAGDFPLEVMNVLNELDIDPSLLELEITEGVIVENPEKVILMIKMLHGSGVKVSIDDFGTGYSSLSYLQRLSVNTIKIDRCFIDAMCKHKESEKLVKAILGISQGLRMTSIAEGVETQEQLDLLNEMGCEQMQGYLISEPLPPEKAELFMAERKQINVG